MMHGVLTSLRLLLRIKMLQEKLPLLRLLLLRSPRLFSSLLSLKRKKSRLSPRKLSTRSSTVMTSPTLAHSPEQVLHPPPNIDLIAAGISLTPVTDTAPATELDMALPAEAMAPATVLTKRFTRADLESAAELATAPELLTAASVHPTM